MYGNFKTKNALIDTFLFFSISFYACSEKNSESRIIEKEKSKTIRFIQLSDLHLGNEIHDKNTLRAITIINSIPYAIDFVVVTGDVFADNINDPNVRKTARMLNRIKYPLHVLPGNHDVSGSDWSATQKYFNELFGKYNNYKDIGKWRFIFYNSEPFRTGLVADVPDLKNMFSAEKKIIIFHHAPCVEDFYQGKIHRVWKHKNTSEKWRKIISNKNMKAIVTGHLHRSELHFTGNVPVHSGPSIAVYWGRQSAFRLYTIREGQIGFQTIYIHP